MNLLGIRAQVTAVGLVKLTDELVRAGVLEQAALDRIKCAIVKELCLSKPASADPREFERTTRRRLDSLFCGEERVGEFQQAS
jgi:hypothetical protein